jgi:hypothetical protein
MGLLRPSPYDASAAEKGSPWARRGSAGSDGTRTCAALALLAAAALLWVGLQWEPAYSSVVHPLRTADSSGSARWVPGRGGRDGHRSSFRGGQNTAQAQGHALGQGKRLLSFAACGDAAMQRVAILSGKRSAYRDCRARHGPQPASSWQPPPTHPPSVLHSPVQALLLQRSSLPTKWQLCSQDCMLRTWRYRLSIVATRTCRRPGAGG